MSDKTNSNNKGDIAIIGMSCRFPGANNYDEFWENLKKGVNSIKEIPPERWDINKFYSPDINEPNKSISKWCGLVDDFDKFDNRFFKISPREAQAMDPQQRLLLEETWHCIEDSGVGTEKLQDKKTAVYIGVMAVDHYRNMAEQEAMVDAYSALGTYQGILANRISHTFGLTGPSQSIDAACASSLVSIHQAKLSLLSGESDYAFAGGVSLNFHPWKYISFSKARMLSPDGQCKTFDKDANGYVPGDGVGVLLLQRTKDAAKSGNRIYGIIKGSAVNQGTSLSITDPRLEAQVNVIYSAWNNADLNPETVTYIEAHGTGTSLGDPIEVEALIQAFRKYKKEKQSCKIGSVKTNIGHLEAAAGVAGIIKVLLMMRYKKIPASLNLKILNPVIDLEQTLFSVVTKLTDWDTQKPLRAGVSSFGMGGANSHMVLEQPPDLPEPETTISEPSPFLISAKSEKSLKSFIEKWHDFIKTPEYLSYNFSDICKTLASGRTSFPYRCGFLGNTKDGIEQFLKQTSMPVSKPGSKRICLITGNFSLSSFSDAKPFFDRHPVFKKHLDTIIKNLPSKIRQIFNEKIWDSSKNELCSLIAGYSYYKALEEMRIKPDKVTGQKGGIWLSLVISGMVSFEDAILILDGKQDPGQIQLSYPKINYYYPAEKKTILPYKLGRTYVHALINGLHPEPEAYDYYISIARLLIDSQFTFKRFMEEWRGILDAKGKNLNLIPDEKAILSEKERIFILIIIVWAISKLNQKWNLKEQRRLKDQRFYEIVDLVIDEVLPKEKFTEFFLSDEPDIAAISKTLNLHHERINHDRSYSLLKEHQTLNFIKNTEKWLKNALQAKASVPEQDNLILLELGKCESNAKKSIPIPDFDEKTFKQALLDLWLNGADIDFTKLYSDGTFQKLALPTYPFAKKRYWIRRSGATGYSAKTNLHPLIGCNTSTLEEHKFTTNFTGKEFFLLDHVVSGKKVLPGIAYIEMARAAGELAGIKKIQSIKNIIWARPIAVKDDQVQEVNISLYRNKDKVEYKVSIADEDGQRVVCSQGNLVINKSANEVIGEHVGAVKIRCKNRRTKQELYASFKKTGLEYGSGFQTIEEFFYSETEALSLLKLPSDLKESFYNFVLHPSLVDGALQTAAVLAQNNDSSKLFLDFFPDEVEIFKPLGTTCYAYVQSTGKNRFNIAILDEQWLVCVKLYNFTIRTPPLEKNKITQENHSELYFRPVWEKDKKQGTEGQSKKSTEFSGSVIIFDTDEKLYHKLDETYERVVLVQPGKKYYENTKAQRHESIVYEIDPKNKEHYNNLITSLYEKEIVPDKIIWLWSKGVSEEDLIDNKLAFGIYPILYVTQALMEKKPQDKIRLLFGYQGAGTRAYGTDVDICFNEAVAGFAKTLCMENSKFAYQTIEFDDLSDTKFVLEKMTEEFQADDGAAEVRYEKGQRWIKRFEEFDLKKEAVNTLPLKENGTYLITGGMSGLGLIFAKYLAENFKANLVLAGRSALDTGKEAKISDLKKSGADAIYIKADMSRHDDVIRLIDKTKSKFKKLNGIIHAEGVVKNSIILKKSKEEMDAVLAPKVNSSINLDKATKDEKLDFFVMFSSISGVMGIWGQSDYSYANTFMDSFAGFREKLIKKGKRFGKTISINWPLWKKGGMQIGAENEKLLAATMGAYPLDTASGICSFQQCLTAENEQVIVIKGIAQKIRGAFNPKPEVKEKTAKNNIKTNVSDVSDVDNKFRKQLSGIVSNILKTEENEIDPDTELIEFGFDSILFTQFANELNGQFDFNILPVVFFDYTTINAFVSYITREHGETLLKHYGSDSEEIFDNNKKIKSKWEDIEI